MSTTACIGDGTEGEESDPEAASEEQALVTSSAIQHVFVITMENNGASTIYGNTADCPYINNTLMKTYAYSAGSTATSSNFIDELPSSIPSEPHYIWMEAATNAFSDHTFTGDSDPSTTNSTKSTSHLVKKLDAKGVSWRAYEEGIDAKTGACPIHSDSTISSSYYAKHNPFVFFQDVSFTAGAPSTTNTYCASHMKGIGQLATDITNNTVQNYSFITPNECHDMHVSGCGTQTAAQKRKAGDTWLAANLPSLISYANTHQGVIFITWDEPERSTNAPFLVVGPHLKSAGYKSTLRYDHSSLVKSVQRIFQVSPTQGIPYLAHAADAATNDFQDFFSTGFYP
ncbi:alkaline phosphatase family protein [soil metagenome]